MERQRPWDEIWHISPRDDGEFLKRACQQPVRSSEGFHLPADFRAFGVVCFLEIVLGLEADDEVRRDAEAELEAQGDGGADSLALADDIA